MNKLCIAAAAMTMSLCLPVWAQQTPITPPAAPAGAASAPQSMASEVHYAKPASDAGNFLGDRINYPYTIEAHGVRLGSAVPPRVVCIPGGTQMRGISKVTATDDKLTEQMILFRVDDEKPRAGCNDPSAKVKNGETVAISADQLRSAPPNRYGWAFGTLMVPYKYQIKGDKSLSGGATLGGYVGYRATVLGTEVQFITFGGATKVDVPAQKDGKTEVQSVAGLSYGIGMLSSIKDAFKVGLVVGADRVSKSANYVNNGRAWLSLSLGYDFFE